MNSTELCSDHRPSVVPKADIDVLNQLIDDVDGVYRVRAGQRVHYLHIPSTVFDEDTMCRPYLLIPQLPDFPATKWVTMEISRGTDGTLESTLSFKPLPAIQALWHPKSIDILSLPRITMYKAAKIACFEWNIPHIENETWVYSVISDHYKQHPNAPRIAPEFLAHLTENGRVMGVLLEKLDGESASIENIGECEAALRELHGMGLVHGDANRYNFIVDPASGCTRMVDFEHVEGFEEEKARVEMASLEAELTEETGRGRGNRHELRR